jgi:hypothetical protein
MSIEMQGTPVGNQRPKWTKLMAAHEIELKYINSQMWLTDTPFECHNTLKQGSQTQIHSRAA